MSRSKQHCPKCGLEFRKQVKRTEMEETRSLMPEPGLENARRLLDVWEAIHKYVKACGGDPARNIYGNTPRANAVIKVEAAINGHCSKDEQSDECAACGKVAPDLGGCEFCDKFLCDDCGVHAHKYVFCSQKCADEWMYTWIEDVGE